MNRTKLRGVTIIAFYLVINYNLRGQLIIDTVQIVNPYIGGVEQIKTSDHNNIFLIDYGSEIYCYNKNVLIDTFHPMYSTSSTVVSDNGQFYITGHSNINGNNIIISYLNNSPVVRKSLCDSIKVIGMCLIGDSLLLVSDYERIYVFKQISQDFKLAYSIKVNESISKFSVIGSEIYLYSELNNVYKANICNPTHIKMLYKFNNSVMNLYILNHKDILFLEDENILTKATVRKKGIIMHKKILGVKNSKEDCFQLVNNIFFDNHRIVIFMREGNNRTLNYDFHFEGSFGDCKISKISKTKDGILIIDSNGYVFWIAG